MDHIEIEDDMASYEEEHPDELVEEIEALLDSEDLIIDDCEPEIDSEEDYTADYESEESDYE